MGYSHILQRPLPASLSHLAMTRFTFTTALACVLALSIVGCKKKTPADLEDSVTKNKPAAAVPAKPADAQPGEAKPADVKPEEAKPADVKPAETPKPTETSKPVEPKPAAEPKPA